MKKRFLALMTALLMLSAMAVPASAEGVYSSAVLNGVDLNLTTAAYSDDYRAFVAAVILLDYMLANNNASETLTMLSASGSTRIAVYGVSFDVYYPTTAGRYLNIMLTPGETAMGYDFGVTTGPSASSGYTYYYVSQTDLLSSLTEIMNALSEN